MIFSLCDLVEHSLPVDVPFQVLKEYSPQKLWHLDPREALENALRNCPALNWEAYQARNRDAIPEDIDPCSYFLKSGIFEGHQLISWHPLKKPVDPNAPLVSVIIAIYNNENYLQSCLQSVLSQTLKNIEIIAVDDASNDKSPAILEKFAKRDNRLKIVHNASNSGIFMTRKNGVNAARGRYLMFMDGDDRYARDACETGYRAILEGYDIVHAGGKALNAANVPEELINICNRQLGEGESGVYAGEEIIDAYFISRTLPWPLWTKIFLRELCVAAFNDLEDRYLVGAEDVYAMLALARLARNVCKIDSRWYLYNYGTGISTMLELDNRYKLWFSHGDGVRAVGEYARSKELHIDFNRLSRTLAHASIEKWLLDVPADEAQIYLDLIIKQYGFEMLTHLLHTRYTNVEQKQRVAQKFRHCVFLPPGRIHIQNIGIFYHRTAWGGVESVIRTMARVLVSQGYCVTIFTEQHSETILNHTEHQQTVFITPGFGGEKDEETHGLHFHEALENHPIDLMLYAGAYAPYLLWDLFLLHHMGIPVIICDHGSFANAFLYQSTLEWHGFRETVLHCAAAVVTPSRLTSLYMRERGINAWHIPNPVSIPIAKSTRTHTQGCIAVVARLGDPLKQANDCLLIMEEVTKAIPWSKMFLIGDFDNNEQKRAYFAQISELNLEGHITITGWTDDPSYFLMQSDVLLSTSWIESCGLSIMEAQAMGLPCVIYDVPTDYRNESIIVVHQGDKHAAAQALINILCNNDERIRLSCIALENIKAYEDKGLFTQWNDLINGFAIYSKIMNFSENDYNEFIRYCGFYSGHQAPMQ